MLQSRVMNLYFWSFHWCTPWWGGVPPHLFTGAGQVQCSHFRTTFLQAINGPTPSDSVLWWRSGLRSANLCSWRSSCCHRCVNITSSPQEPVLLTCLTSTHPLTALEGLPGTLLTANISTCVNTHHPRWIRFCQSISCKLRTPRWAKM